MTHLSLPVDATFSTDHPTLRAVFFGLGSDGTVGANKHTTKIVGELTDLYTQGYFVYDSKKSGSMTVSHLRFDTRPIRSTYLITEADVVACHQFGLLDRTDVLRLARPGATFLLNSPYGPDDTWQRLPRKVQQQILDLGLEVHVIDAHLVARESGLAGQINTVMQVAFFAVTDSLLPIAEALDAVRNSVRSACGKRGGPVVKAILAGADVVMATSALLQRGPAFLRAGQLPGHPPPSLTPLLNPPSATNAPRCQRSSGHRYFVDTLARW